MTELEAVLPDASHSIDWSRLASPGSDGYDTAVILQLAGRRPPSTGENPFPAAAAFAGPTLFEGSVAIRNRSSGGLPDPPYSAAPLDHPNLAQAESIVRLWPDAAEQFARIIDTVQPWIDTRCESSDRPFPGSSSDSLDNEFGVIMVTVDHPFGLAQAFVHEMAHHKLRAMGVSVTRARRLVTNDPSELYISPIVTGRKRPMTAVLHAQYAFMHVAALDVAVYRAAAASDRLRREAVYFLARNIPRLETGYRELERHLRTDDAGAAFSEAFMAWSSQILDAGRAILETEGYGMPPL